MRICFVVLVLLFGLSACKAPSSQGEVSGIDRTNITQGKKQWQRLCSSCHSVDPDKAGWRGPNLFGVIGRKAGSKAGFQGYSPALKEWGQAWDQDLLTEYLIHPASFLQKHTQNPKATSTMNVRLGEEAIRRNIAAYLASLNDEWAFKHH